MNIFIHPHTSNNFQVKWCCPRTELIVQEGLSKLDVNIVNNESIADFIIWHHVPQNYGQKSFDIINQIDPKKLIIIDSIDENDQYFLPELNPDRYFLYFKRSLVKVDGGVRSVISTVERQYAWDYAILDGFVQPEQEKTIDAGSYLRDSCYYRALVLRNMYFWQRNTKSLNCVLGPVSDGSRSDNDGKVYFDKTYFDYLARTKVVVSSGPYGWCGDSRGAEAVANKCLYISNEFFDLMPNPPIDGEHCLKFNPLDNLELYQLLDYIFFPVKETQNLINIGKFGYEHCMKYHTSKARMEYVLQKIEENS